jgi:hypothetical protein
VLFLVPGLLFLALLPARAREDLEPDEALFLTLALSVAASSWLALLLAELGRFHVLTAAAVMAVTCAAIAFGARRRLAWPLRLRPHPTATATAALRAWAPALVLFGLSFALHARPTEYLFGGRDPGTYVNAMALIGRTGGIVYTDPAVRAIPPEYVSLFYREPQKPGAFEWGRFMGFPLERPETGRVVPEFFHLFPAFGAYLFQTMGVKGALATPPVFGVLATLAVYFALRALLGRGAALLGALLLAANVLQVWFARFPVSEMVSQLLIFLGLAALLRAERGAGDAWGALAGAAFGLSLLVRIDSVLIAAPLLLFASTRAVQGAWPRRRLAALGVPFALLALHAGLHGLFFARKYVLSIATRPYWRQPAWVWALALLAVVAAVFLARRFGRRWAAWAAAHEARLRAAAALVVVALAAYAWFVRPRLSALAGADGNPSALRLRVEPPTTALLIDGRPAGLVADFAGEAGLPLHGEHELRFELLGHVTHRVAVDVRSGQTLELRHTMAAGEGETRAGRLGGPLPGDSLLARLGFPRLAAHDAQALRRFGWFVTPLGVALGLVGLVIALREGRREWFFPLLLTLSFALFYFYKMRVWNDYYFAMRRVMPVTLPFTLGFLALALARLASRGAWARALAGVGALTLGLLYARDTRPLLGYTDWRGAVGFTDDLALRFGADDAVVFEQPRSIHLLALPLWAVHGRQVLELARFNPDPSRLNGLVRAWRGTFRQVYFVHTYSTDLCGVFLQRVQDLEFGTLEWERPTDRPPRRPESRGLRFTVSRVVPPEELHVPPLPEVDLGGSDDFQVSGFFDKEAARDPRSGEMRTFRWSARCASVYLPGARAGAELRLSASADKRPPDDPARVRVSLNGVELGAFTPDATWQEFALRLPAPLPPGPPVLRLDTSDWRPARRLPGSTDVRDLGIVLDRITVVDPRGAGPSKATE